MTMLITWCLVALTHCVRGELIHRRPPSGIGELLISEDKSHEDYNTRTLMVTFELGCLNEQQDEQYISFSNYNDYHGALADKESRKRYQSSKVDSIINHFNGCLKHIDSDGHFKHFQHDSTGFGISFIDLVSDGINCLKNHVNASSFDYDGHCVHMFTYEPLYNYHNSGNNFGSGYTKFTDPSQYKCLEKDNSYLFPLVNGDNGNGVDLYIVDSGVLDSHDQFAYGQVVHELGDGPARYDPLGFIDSHGTHVAATAGGNDVGVSRFLTIYDYRVCVYSSYDIPESANDVSCPLNLILTALDMIVARMDSTGGARRGVINLGLGGSRSTFDYLYQYYFDEIIGLGGIPVVSAGNDDIDACGKTPAFSSSAITVGAVDASFNKAPFSNFGKCVDVFAPGVDIISSAATGDSDYAAFPGTSMAASHISGFVANLLLVDPTLHFNQVLAILVESKQQPGVASILINNDECATYDCVFPIYLCDVLPSNYVGYTYAIDNVNFPHVHQLQHQLLNRKLHQAESIAPWLFVIDDTGSMGNEISGVLNFVSQAVIDIEAAGFMPEYYVLSRFDDPESQTFAVRFEDSELFLAAVDDIAASGGGDCPEYAFSGIRQAADLLDTSSVILASAQAEMFLFTDAPANDLDSNDVASVAALLRAKNVRLHSFYSVGCGLDSRFYDLSITTGGLFLVATSSTFDATLGIMDDFIDGSDTTTLSRLVVDGVPGTGISLTVPIDSSVECFRVMTGSDALASGGMNIYYPDGTSFSSFSADQQVTTPYAEWLKICLAGTNYGDWRFESTFGFSASPYIIVYTTDAGIAFDFSLIDATTLSSVGAFVVYNAGSSIRAVFKLASSANPILLGSVDTVTLVNKDGATVTQVQTAVSDGASCYYADFAHDDIVSDGIEEFYFSIEGTDSDGNDFIRTSEVIYEIVMSGFIVNLDCGLGELITIDLNTNKVCTITVTVDDASSIPEVDLSFETDNLFLSGFVTVTLSESTVSINPATNQGSTTLTIANTDACDPFCEIEGERMDLIVYAAFGDVGDADRFVNFASQLFQFGELSGCRERFGLECNWCKDDVGCMACRPFYTRTLSPIDGLYFCQRDESTAPTPEEEDYTANPCVTDNCRGEVNTNCEILEWWGCRKCYDGYFRLNNDHLCVECNIIPNCGGCNIDEFEWGGCDVCASGSLTWDTGLGYRRCL